MEKLQIIRNCILGHAVADALGVPVEFCSRSSLQDNPVQGMRAYGTHYQPEGTWSDDTSMTLATLDSLSAGPDYTDIMEKFCAWEDTAAYTATDRVFDIGIGTRTALARFREGAPAPECGGAEEHNNGNGSLMRIIPAALYCHWAQGLSTAQKIAVIHDISALTHAHKRSLIGCGVYTFLLWKLVETPSEEALAAGLSEAKSFYAKQEDFHADLDHYARLFRPDFRTLPESEISSSGYVVHSLEAAVWCLLTTKSYAECVLKAVNLGDDTDTVAAIAGGLAGAVYGEQAIPAQWLQALKKRELIETLCEKFEKGIGAP